MKDVILKAMKLAEFIIDYLPKTCTLNSGYVFGGRFGWKNTKVWSVTIYQVYCCNFLDGENRWGIR